MASEQISTIGYLAIASGGEALAATTFTGAKGIFRLPSAATVFRPNIKLRHHQGRRFQVHDLKIRDAN